MIIQHERFIIEANDLENAGYVSSHIKKMLKAHNVNKAIIKKVAIATYEAEINVVIHSYGGECRCSFHHNRIHVVFIDRGPGIPDINQAMKEGYSTASTQAINYGFGAGMGLSNIRKASDEFKLDSSPQGTILDIVIYLELGESNESNGTNSNN